MSTSIDAYLQDASGFSGEAADVFVPASTDELRQIVQDCAARHLPLTIAGAGTGLTGARVPKGGAVVSLERFRHLSIEAGRARCGAGVLLSDLHAQAAHSHQFFGPNPTEASASIGGIYSTNAGGARSFRYRSVRYHALAAEVTFADGSTRRFRKGDKVDFDYRPVHWPAVTKNSAGYYLQPDLEWVDLMAGSEGTLGIVSELELRLLPSPPAILSGVVFFATDTDALDAVDAWRSIQELRLLEFMDAHALDLLREKFSDIPLGSGAALFIEQNLTSEDDAEVDLWSRRLQEQSAWEDASWFGFTAADQARFRDFRHALPVMVTDAVRRNGFPKFSTDFAVPFEHHREFYLFCRDRCRAVAPGRFTIFGHAGDGNNHINLLPQTAGQAREGEELIYELAERVVALKGTIAAEHGIGKIKTDLLKLMYTGEEIEAMRAVKNHLDPHWLLGRDTLFEPPPAS